jgi:cytoskeletal protein CcmA (bactofilin family)
MGDGKSKQTVIEDGTEFEGVVVSLSGLAVSGKLKGEVTAPALTVERSGTVDGRVRVEKLVSHGQLSGEIEAESVELGGRVGDRTILRANEIEVKLSPAGEGLQVTFGDCELQVGQRAATTQPQKRDVASRSAQPQPVVAPVAAAPKAPR